MKFEKYWLYTLLLSICLSTNLDAQNINDSRIDSLRRQANLMAYSFLTLDTLTFIKFCDKGIIDSFFNGEKNVGSSFANGKIDTENMGFKNLSVQIGEASKIATIGKQIYAFIQTYSIGLIKEDTIKSQSFYLAISNDNGLNWRFIDQSFITVAGIKKLFPNYDGQLKIPILKEPEFIKRQ